MESKPMTLQDLIRNSGPLNNILAASYINQIAGDLEKLHSQRRICHLDVRPDMILFNPDGRVTLKDSSVSQSYSEEMAIIDLRDLKAVHNYLLTGKKVEEMPNRKNETNAKPLETKEKTIIESKKNYSLWKMIVGVCVLCLLGIGVFLFVKKTTAKPTLVNCDYADFNYQGEWKNDMPHGKGIAKYYDGRYYEGCFVKGKRSDKNARFVYADGNVFEGTFTCDTIQEGKVTLASGEYYFIGKFSQGRPFSGYWFRASDNQRVEQIINGKEILL
ncbi:MAG: hypothetical protein SPL55_03860 [Prevotella sp.]|nr:hypothetical protein [Prevotella sp.]